MLAQPLYCVQIISTQMQINGMWSIVHADTLVKGEAGFIPGFSGLAEVVILTLFPEACVGWHEELAVVGAIFMPVASWFHTSVLLSLVFLSSFPKRRCLAQYDASKQHGCPVLFFIYKSQNPPLIPGDVGVTLVSYPRIHLPKLSNIHLWRGHILISL